MSKRDPNRRENDIRQSGEGQPAFGEDERDFGAGGQTMTDTLAKDDAPSRDTKRNPILPKDKVPRNR